MNVIEYELQQTQQRKKRVKLYIDKGCIQSKNSIQFNSRANSKRTTKITSSKFKGIPRQLQANSKSPFWFPRNILTTRFISEAFPPQQFLLLFFLSWCIHEVNLALAYVGPFLMLDLYQYYPNEEQLCLQGYSAEIDLENQ